jgi:hypothetical protein
MIRLKLSKILTMTFAFHSVVTYFKVPPIIKPYCFGQPLCVSYLSAFRYTHHLQLKNSSC